MNQATSSLKPFRAGFWFGGFNGLTWIIGLGTPMVLLAEQLGASTLQVGLATSSVYILLPLQVLSTSALARLGYRRQMVIGWVARGGFMLVPLGLALLAPASPEPWMVNALVASVFCFCTFRAFGVAAHIPWMAAILPSAIRGRFFATDQAITSVVGVTTLLFSAWLFSALPTYSAFAIVYGIAVLGSGMAVVNLLRLPDAPPPAAIAIRELAGETRRLALKPGPFRHYLLLVLTGAIVTSSLPAFTAYYLKVETGLSSGDVLAFTAAQFAGQIIGTWWIRHWIDALPVRRLFQASVVAIGLVDLFWLALVMGREGLVPLLPAAYLLFGIGVGIANATHYTYLPELSDEPRRPVSVAVFTASQGLLAGIAPVLWGVLLKSQSAEPGIDLERFSFYFGLGAALSATLVVLYARLPDRRFPTGRTS